MNPPHGKIGFFCHCHPESSVVCSSGLLLDGDFGVDPAQEKRRRREEMDDDVLLLLLKSEEAVMANYAVGIVQFTG